MFRNPNRRYFYYGSENSERLFGMVAPCIGIIFCSFVGCGLGLMGIVMTTVAYTGKAFPDDPTKIIGPIFLVLGLIAICVAIGLCIYTMKKRKMQGQQSTQGQPTQNQGACSPLQPYPAPPVPYGVAPQYRPPDVYDPEARKLATAMPTSYEKSAGQTPFAPGSGVYSPPEQPAYNPYYAPSAPQ